MKLRKFTITAFAGLGLVGASASSQAAVTFAFNYLDAPGVGFNDAAEGTARKQALTNAVNAFSQSLSSYTATINLDINGAASGSTLMSAGSNAVADSFAGGGFGRYEVVRNKILSGTDLNGAASDGVMSVNWGINWEIDPNPGAVDGGAGEFDWYSTLYHEFTHAIGFSHGIVDQGAQSGEDGFGAGGFGSADPGEWSKFDEFLSDSASNRIISSTTFESTMNQAAWNALVIGGDTPGGLFFDGPNAKAANGGAPVPLHTPNPYEGGSSISHLQATEAGMMKAAAPPGLSDRVFTAVELGILQDLGYTNIQQIGVAVPEPSTSLLALLGLSVVGLRRRR